MPCKGIGKVNGVKSFKILKEKTVRSPKSQRINPPTQTILDRDHRPNSSKRAITDSRRDIDELKAAKANKMKNKAPIMSPPDIWLKAIGRVMKIKPGP